jgi:hypothetical protein
MFGFARWRSESSQGASNNSQNELTCRAPSGWSIVFWVGLDSPGGRARSGGPIVFWSGPSRTLKSLLLSASLAPEGFQCQSEPWRGPRDKKAKCHPQFNLNCGQSKFSIEKKKHVFTCSSRTGSMKTEIRRESQHPNLSDRACSFSSRCLWGSILKASLSGGKGRTKKVRSDRR